MKKIIALVVINLAFTGAAFAKTGKQDGNVPCSQITANLKGKLGNGSAAKAEGAPEQKSDGKPAEASGAQ